jgi:hypothetical protein
MTRPVPLSRRGGPDLVDPASDTPIFPLHRARPGTAEAGIPRFGELRWQLAALEHGQSGRTQAVNWETFPASLRVGFMRAGWAVINIPTPTVLLRRPGSSTRPQLSAGSLQRTFRAWRFFAAWLSQRQVCQLHQVDRPVLLDYPQVLHGRGLTPAAAAIEMFAITRLWAYAPFLLPADRIATPPWDEPGAEPGDFLGEAGGPGAENTTVPVHPAVMSPLLIWALRTVTDFAPDILAAWREACRLHARIAPTAMPGGREQIRAYLRHLRETGQPLPVFTGAQAGALAQAHRGMAGQHGGPAADRPLVHNAVIAAVAGVSVAQVATLLRDRPHEWDGLRLGTGAPLPVPVTARLDGRAWTQAIDFAGATDLALHLSTAALITVSYLSGMRPKEVLHLQRGCGRVEPQEDGTVRYVVTGRHFKGVTDEAGNTIPDGEIWSQPWTVIELVHHAITILEKLTDGQQLFPRKFSKAPKPRTYLGDVLTPGMANERIARFTGWANNLADVHGRLHETIPDDPAGAVTMRRLRRTVAWFINRQPGGRIALGIQYGHLRASLAESYGGRSTVDMLQILDLEQALATADALSEAAERLNTGEGVSGPAAARYIAAAAQFQAAYPGGFVSTRQHKALLDNPRLQVFDHPQATLTCNHDPFKALCDPNRGKTTSATQRTPSLDRCHPACANISRTDTHIGRVQAEINQIEAELTDDLAPHPIRQRLLQRHSALEQIIIRHEATRIHLDTDPGSHQ